MGTTVKAPKSSGGTTYTAGNGLDLSGTEFATDIKSNGGLVIESTELAVDLGASSITGTLAVGDGGTGATTLTDGGILLGSGTGAITAMSVLANGEMIVGDGTTDPVAESGATLRTSIGVGTTDDVEFNTLTVGDGSNSAPSITNSGDTNTGIYFPAEDNVGITAGGTQIVNVSSSGINVTGTITGDTSLTLDSTTLTTAELGVLDGVTAGDAAGGKALVLDSNKDLNDTTEVIRALRIDTFGVGVAPSMVSGQILASNDITAFSSDKRLKETIVPIQDPLSKLSTISGYTYRWNIEKCNQVGFKPVDIPEVGVLAQEINEVLPEAIKPAPFDRDKDGNSVSGDNYLTVQYEKIVPLLIECIKAQQTQIDELKVCLSKLK